MWLQTGPLYFSFHTPASTSLLGLLSSRTCLTTFVIFLLIPLANIVLAFQLPHSSAQHTDLAAGPAEEFLACDYPLIFHWQTHTHTVGCNKLMKWAVLFQLPLHKGLLFLLWFTDTFQNVQMPLICYCSDAVWQAKWLYFVCVCVHVCVCCCSFSSSCANLNTAFRRTNSWRATHYQKIIKSNLIKLKFPSRCICRDACAFIIMAKHIICWRKTVWITKLHQFMYLDHTDCMSTRTLAAQHTHTTPPTYQLAVGVNCVGPQGKNNIAPKTERQCVFCLSAVYFNMRTKLSKYFVTKHKVSPLLMAK